MEPLSALSLAGNILQFIEFTTKLLSSSVEIYKSSTGTLVSRDALEIKCRQLSDLSNGFVTTSRSTQPSASELALRSIANSCRDDCARLVTALNSLKVDGGNHRVWKSFRAALKSAWKEDQEIESLTNKLKELQSTMTLHICAISNEWLQNMNQHLRNLERQHAALDKLEEISSNLQEIRSRISMPDFVFSSTELNELANKVSHLSLTKRDSVREQMVLNSLNYSSRKERHDKIPEAHARTFSWIFETPNRELTSGGDFMKWLHESDDVFWITGKPGSGKSTLMKYLANHPKTMDAVKQWAAPERVLVASHFFWLSGIPVQKSMEGLLQNLLYEIFEQCPELIAETCPSRWERSSSCLTKQDWTLTDMLDCFQAMKRNCNSMVKFCFFVDGLDEFDGDYMDISQILLEIAKCPRIKLCVASRPLNEFQDQFGANTSIILRVHELTRNDIMNYARCRLEEHPRWSVLGLDAQAAQQFLENIADSARGVFLWVTLVIQSLRNGLSNDDTMDDLDARLNALPKTLETFYKYMLDSVESVYRRKSAHLLQMQLASQHESIQRQDLKQMPWIMALLHEQEHSNPDYAIDMPWKPLTTTDIQTLRERTSRRLNAKCCCMIEICGKNLEFIHRTASDYLKTPEMVDYIQNRNGGGFDAYLSILKVWVACLKMGVLDPVHYYGLIDKHALYSMTNTFPAQVFKLAEITRSNSNGVRDDQIFKLFDCLEEITTQVVYSEEEFRANYWLTPVCDIFEPRRSYLAFKKSMIYFYEHDYAIMKLSNDADYFRGLVQPVLWSMLRISGTSNLPCWRPPPYQPWKNLLDLLLQKGYHPNEIIPDRSKTGSLRVIKHTYNIWADHCIPHGSSFHYSERQSKQSSISIWSAYLMKCGIDVHFNLHSHNRNYRVEIHSLLDLDDYSLKLDSSICSLLLHHGADPNAHPTPFTTAWVNFIHFGIKRPYEVTDYDSYLKTLDDFFKYGADLSVSTPYSGENPSLPSRMATGWSTFCEALEDTTGSGTEEELKFISQITTRMVQQAISTQWSMGNLPSITKKVFPETLYQPILDMISENPAKRDDTKTWGKRMPEEESSAEGESKRLKT
ncbi:hypothetical protein F4805DRAFT_428754 [Annulohypoxylon moriforme]|nr:hypothetical protein F4805DRAFT_428754 [Annulohypoxylon moriforme]